MPSLSLMVGNVGSGKSMIARRLALQGASVVCSDAIQSILAGGRYGLYDARKKSVYHTIEDCSVKELIKNRDDVVIDRTNMTVSERSRWITLGKELGCFIKVYDFGKGTVECLDRRLRDARGIPASIWKDVFNSMSDKYESPMIGEGIDNIIEVPPRFCFHAFDFDGVVVENRFPEIGGILTGTVDRLNKLWESISNVVIIWTCRSGDFLNLMNEFLLKNKIPFDFINKNPFVDYGSPKIFANYYYDDRNAEIY